MDQMTVTPAPTQANVRPQNPPSSATSNSDGIFSHIDVPADDQITVVETCLIRGWTCSKDRIESVTILVDGRLVEQFLPNLERPDVALVYPNIPDSGKSGFDVTFYAGPLSQGVHELQLIIRDKAGHERT